MNLTVLALMPNFQSVGHAMPAQIVPDLSLAPQVLARLLYWAGFLLTVVVISLALMILGVIWIRRRFGKLMLVGGLAIAIGLGSVAYFYFRPRKPVSSHWDFSQRHDLAGRLGG